MNTFLICFAGEDKRFPGRFYRSQAELIKSAKQYFTGYIKYTFETLPSQFLEENKQIMEEPRGCGYWLWKSYIIAESLKHVGENDIIVYVDSGNSIINDPKPLFNITKEDSKGILLFDNRDGAPAGTVWRNFEFTTYDCFVKMSCLEDRYINGNQVNSSYIFLRKNEYTVNFINEWYNYCRDIDIIGDKDNKIGPNFQGFRSTRHDQSILSLLSIKHNITIGRDPSEWGTPYINKDLLRSYPQIFHHHRGFF